MRVIPEVTERRALDHVEELGVTQRMGLQRELAGGG
jgi:hypothetical protein